MKTRATLKDLNDFIKKIRPDYELHLYKGKGYFYFIDDSDQISVDSIYVYAMSHADYAWWCRDVESMIEEAEARGIL